MTQHLDIYSHLFEYGEDHPFAGVLGVQQQHTEHLDDLSQATTQTRVFAKLPANGAIHA
jgi:hypothetical protein